jgi:predicted MFS family arabinose efflux permease
MRARAIFVLALGGFATITSLRAADPLLILIGADYGISPAGASSTITAIVAGYGLAQFVHGPLGDRIGKFRLMAAGAAVASLASLACALAPSLPALLAARFVAGAMTGALIPLSMAWIGDVVPYENRQGMLARFTLGNWLGLSLGALASGVLAEPLGWRAIFWVLTAVYALLALLLARELRVNPLTRRPADAPASLGEAYRRMWGLLREPWPRTLLAVVVVDGIVIFSPMAFIPLHAQARFGLGTGGGAAMMLALMTGGFAYTLNAGRLVARFGEAGLLAGGGALMGLMWVALLVAPGVSLAAAALVVLGLGLPMIHNTLQVVGTQMAPAARGAGMTLFAAALFVGQSIGIWAEARMIDAWGTDAVVAFAAVATPLLAFAVRGRLIARSQQAAARSAVSA